MGADVVAWRSCPLQKALGPEAFLGKLKLLAYKTAVEMRVPPGERDEVRFAVRVGAQPDREMAYAEVAAEIGSFADGIDECTACPLSGGRPIGCYRFLTFPIDEAFEQLVFDYFVAAAGEAGLPAWQIAENVIPRVEASGTPWHVRRGTDPSKGALALLPRALEGSVRGLRIDSAQLMQALFITLENSGPLHAYAAFFAGFVPYARARVKTESSRTLGEIEKLEQIYRAASELAKTDRCAVLVDA